MNLTIDINNKTEIRNAITLLESLLPKPAAKVAAKAAKKPAKKTGQRKTPPGIPNPPEGFIYAGVGPLRHQTEDIDFRIARLDGRRWDVTGWCGSRENHHYAVKKGSKIAKLNGL